MSHSIQIPDTLWELYDGSPSAMRDTLWQAKVRPPETDSVTAVFEKLIKLQWQTRCNICSAILKKGEPAVYQVPEHGPKQIVCVHHMTEERQEELTLDSALETIGADE